MTSLLDGLSLMIASQFDSRCCSMRLTVTLLSFLDGLFLMTTSRFGGRCCSMTACSMTSLLACTCRRAFCGRCTPHVCCAPQTVVLLVATFTMNPYHNPSWDQCFRNVSVGSALVTPSASISELLIHATVSSFSSIISLSLFKMISKTTSGIVSLMNRHIQSAYPNGFSCCMTEGYIFCFCG